MKRALACCLLLAACARPVERLSAGSPPAHTTGPPEVIDVTKPPFLARGDGVTDDGPSIQRAIHAGVARGRRGLAAVVYLPAGIYRVRRHIELSDDAGHSVRGLVVRGDGPTSAITFDHGTLQGEGVGIRGRAPRELTVRDLRIGATAAGAGLRLGIALSGGRQVVLRDLDISGAGTGTFQGRRLGPSAGIFLDGGIADVHILDNVLHDNGSNDGTSWHILVYGPEGATNLTIRGNRCVTSPDSKQQANFGIGVFDSNHVTLDGNLVEGVVGSSRDADGYGIMLYGSRVGRSHDHIVTRNVVRHTGGTGIYVQSSPNAAVIGNLLEDTARTQSAVSLAVGAIGFNSGPGVISSNIVRGVGSEANVRVPPAGIAIQTCGSDSTCVDPDGAARGVVVSGNNVAHTAGFGIALRAAPHMAPHNSTIIGNTITSTRGGIGTVGGSRVQGLGIVGNTIVRAPAPATDGAPGIYLVAVEDSVVSSNVVLYAAGQGIVLQDAHRNIVEGNLVRARGTGIDLAGTANLVVGNSIDVESLGPGRWGIAESGKRNQILGNLTTGDPSSPGVLSSGADTVRALNGGDDAKRK